MEDLYLSHAHAECAVNFVTVSACWAKTLPSLSRYYLTPQLLFKPAAGIGLEKFPSGHFGLCPALARPLTLRLLAALDTSLSRRTGVREAEGR